MPENWTEYAGVRGKKKFLSHPVSASEIFLNWNSEQPPRGMELQEKEVQKD